MQVLGPPAAKTLRVEPVARPFRNSKSSKRMSAMLSGFVHPECLPGIRMRTGSHARLLPSTLQYQA